LGWIMRDRQLYAHILGIQSPWAVAEVKLNMSEQVVEVFLESKSGKRMPCSVCEQPCPGYDSKERRWRHLDTCQLQTLLVARVPRVRCPEHGVRQVKVPWAEDNARFTALFEALVIDWLHEASNAGVAERFHLSWDEVDGIMQRAVKRGLARRSPELPAHIGVDEKAFRRGHDYVTIVSNSDDSTVLYVADERKRGSLDGFYEQFEEEARATVETVAMDMWGPYIQSTEAHIPDAKSRIVFDKFHIAKHLGEAVDKVRRQEHKQLTRAGDDSLKGTKYLWLKHPDNIDDEKWRDFQSVRESNLKTARAWAIKETAMELWESCNRAEAMEKWKQWYGWAIRSRLEPVKRVARMIKNHLDGVINAVLTNVTNAGAESINSVVQKLKVKARGFRNRERFKNAIYFHLGGLNLYPSGITR
jgi:transposase